MKLVTHDCCAVALSVFVASLAAAGVFGCGLAPAQGAGADITEAGTMTRGGLAEGTRIIRVTSLADSGPGTLREAVTASGARVVVFDIAGIIVLETDLRIDQPYLTVAGQTAPAPGILLRGAKMRISSHDVVIQHISMRPGRRDPVPDNADGISIGPCDNCKMPAYGVRLENLSVGWAIDENIGLWGSALSGITLRNSLVAEALADAGHAKGEHSMGMLVGADVQSVEVVGNLFASNMNRNPVLGPGTSAFVANNYIYNPGRAAMHMYRGPGIRASFIGNVIRQGPDTDKRMAALQWQGDFVENYPDAKIFARDNHCCGGLVEGDGKTGTDAATFAATAPTASPSWTVMPAIRVRDWVMRYAGARPAERNAVDVRVVASVDDNSGRIIDDPGDVGGYPEVPVVTHDAALPSDPFAMSGVEGKTRLETWLCLRHLEVGGAPTADCPESHAEMRRALFPDG